MLAAALLALTVAQGAPAAGKLDQLAAEPPKADNVAVVVLNCQVDAKALVDCKAVNADADSHAAAEAIRMAAGVTVPESLAAGGPSRILIRMKVAP